MRGGHAVTGNEILKLNQDAKTLSRESVIGDMKEGKGRLERLLRALAAFQRTQVQFQEQRLTNVQNSGSKGSDALFWPLRAPGTHGLHRLQEKRIHQLHKVQ